MIADSKAIKSIRIGLSLKYSFRFLSKGYPSAKSSLRLYGRAQIIWKIFASEIWFVFKRAQLFLEGLIYPEFYGLQYKT